MIKVKDKQFEVYITEQKILGRIKELGDQISKDYAGKDPLVVGVLNGSLYFLADLSREFGFETELALVKYKSYEGTQSTGKFNVSLSFDERVKDRNVLLIEDIVDTGATLTNLMRDLTVFEPASVAVISLLLKPSVFKGNFEVKYVGFEIPEKFVLGYGLDYDGRGRNLRDIYVLSQ